MKMNIYIERLVLEGITIPGHRQPVLLRAVENELARLLTTGDSAGGVDGVHGVGEIRLTGNEAHNPTALGRQIAHSVYNKSFGGGLRGRFFQKEPPNKP